MTIVLTYDEGGGGSVRTTVSPRVASLLTALLIGVGALPLLVLSPAPLADWSSHLARVWITDRVLHGDAFWSARYHFMGLWIPNAVLDAVVLGLMRLGLSVTTAGGCFLLFCYGTFVLGFVSLARTRGMPIMVATALAVIFFFTGDVLFGLVNFMTGIGLALLAGSFWLRSEASLTRRLLIAVVATPVILFCHIVAALVFSGLCGCYDLLRPYRSWSRRLVEAAPATLALAISVLGYELSRSGTDTPIIGYNDNGLPGWFGIVDGKVHQVADGLSSGNQVADVMFGIVLVGLAVLMYQWRWHYRLRVILPILAVGLLPVVAPYQVGEGQMLDARLFMVAIAVATALLPWARFLDSRIQLGIVGVCLIRTLLLAYVWHGYGPIYAEARARLAALPPHSTLLSAYSDLPGFYQFKQPPMWHVASFAVFDDVFTPEVFADPTQQPLAINVEWRPLWLWTHAANARTPENMATVRQKAERYCTIDPRSHLLILHTTEAERFSIEDHCHH